MIQKLAGRVHRVLALLVLVVSLAWVTPVAAHPMATDYFELDARGQDVELAFEADLQGVFEVLTGRRFDDTVSDAAEAQRLWERWTAYFEPRFTVLAGSTGTEPLAECVATGPLEGPTVEVAQQRYRFSRRYRCPVAVFRLTVRSTLFVKAPTMHHLSGRYWIDGCSRLFFFSERSVTVGTDKAKLDCAAPSKRRISVNQASVPAGGQLERSGFLELVMHHVPLGVSHILEGVDHLLFVISLVLGIASMKELWRLVTAFTVAHSVTLLLAALKLLEVPSRLVEVMIAASIAYVAIENLLRKAPPLERRLLVTAAFGLIHGLGFSGAIRAYLPSGVGMLTALLSFNVGVELGQLLVIAPVFGLLLLARRRGWWPGRPAQVANGLLIAAGVAWAALRLLGYSV